MKILFISLSNLSVNPRPNRQIELLDGKHDIYTYAAGPTKQQYEKHFQINHKKVTGLFNKLKAFIWVLTKNWEKIYWNGFEENLEVYNFKYDLVIAHDPITAPLAIKIAKNSGINCKVSVDLTEYTPREWENRLFWRLSQQPFLTYLCKEYLPHVFSCTVVNESIRQEYIKNFGLKKTLPVRNACRHFTTVNPSIIDSKIRIITHGLAISGRSLEEMIDVMSYLPSDKYELNLMLLDRGDGTYLKSLKKRAIEYKNINFLDPVPFENIVPFTSKFDIGLFLLYPVNFNYAHALPNKFFEFVQARLCIAIGPSVEMARLVREFGLGVVSESFEAKSMAEEILKLSTDDIMKYKQNCHVNALELSSEKDDKLFKEMIKEIEESIGN
jgi:hypothetical protein